MKTLSPNSLLFIYMQDNKKIPSNLPLFIKIPLSLNLHCISIIDSSRNVHFDCFFGLHLTTAITPSTVICDYFTKATTLRAGRNLRHHSKGCSLTFHFSPSATAICALLNAIL
ncbi:hypothetical protein V8G54_012338 [Vigna mungo]|uniref:Uncharacterized protein n=1 Tax=Vigna mungo TaxID=3915 RepID=A0AAQ3NTC7_VIGMU